MIKAGIGLAVVFLLLYVIPLGVRPMAIPDETRYGEISREMIASGNWISPTLNGLRYFEKPILGDWLHSVSILLFGANAFAIRFPSAFAAGISALLIWLGVRKFGGGATAACLAAALYLTCVEAFIGGTFCVLDGVFSLCVTATLVGFFFAWRNNGRPGFRNRYLILSGIGCGLAFLAKGFIAFVLPVVVVVPFLLWQRQWKELFRIWRLPLLAVVVVVLPWAVAIQLKEPDFWRFFFWHEHVQRFLNPESGQHPKPFWYFVPIVLVGSLPWSFWIPHAVSGLKNLGFRDPFRRFMVCWLLFPFLFFSASGGKLATYILPCYPPLMILLAAGFLRWRAMPGNAEWFSKDLRASAILAAFVAGALIPFPRLSAGFGFLFRSGEEWKAAVLAAALGGYAIFLAKAGRQTILSRQLVFCCLAPVALLFCVHFTFPDRFKVGRMPGDFLVRNLDRVGPDTLLMSDEDMISAVCWFSGRNDVYLLGKPGECEYGLTYADAGPRLIEMNAIADFLAQRWRKDRIVLIAKYKFYDRQYRKWPRPARVIRDCGFVMAEYAPEPAIPAEATGDRF